HRLGQFFPAITDHAAALAVLAEDVDGEDLFRRTRPPGAFDPEHVRPPGEPEPADLPGEDVPETASPGWLRNLADTAARRGNQVRAAILRQRAVPLSPVSQRGGLRGAARNAIDRLVARLQRALSFSAGEQPDWSRCLLALLEPAAQGIWN